MERYGNTKKTRPRLRGGGTHRRHTGAAVISGISRLSDDMAYVGETRLPDILSFSRLNYLRMAIRAESLEGLRAEDSSSRDTDVRRILDRRGRAWEEMDRAWMTLLETKRRTKKGEQLLESLKVQFDSWRDSTVRRTGFSKRSPGPTRRREKKYFRRLR